MTGDQKTSREAAITINGHDLTPAQSMTVRCALEGFATTLAEMRLAELALGDDNHGRSMAEAYRHRINEIRRLIIDERR